MWDVTVERENSQFITSWYIILPSPQSIVNYKPNHTSARVSNDMSSPTLVSNDISSPIGSWHVSSWKSKHFGHLKDATYLGKKILKPPPIRLWDMSPIKFRHMSLTHPQTPVNRSIPNAFLQTKTFRVQATSKKIQKHSEVQKLYRN